MEDSIRSTLRVEILSYHSGVNGKIGDNKELIKHLNALENTFDFRLTLEENGEQLTNMYTKKGTCYMYFTKVFEDGRVDAYLTKSEQAPPLFTVLAVVRDYRPTNIYYMGLVQWARYHGFDIPANFI